jgi:RecA-family ATPase
LVLDSKADVFGGNEVSRAQARGFVGMLRKLAMRSGAAIVLLGHPSLTGISSGSGSSGSTHWRNAVRSGLHLRRPDDPDAHPDMRVLEVVKANYSTCGKQITLRWSAGVFEPVEGVQHADRQEAADHVDATFLRLLTAFCQEGRRVSHSTGANYAPAVFAKDPRAGGIRSSGFTTAMMRLLAAGKVKVESVGPPSRRLQQLVVAGGE